MADILSPTGIEKPLGGELHSRAQYLRNLDRANQIALDAVAETNRVRHVEFVRASQNDEPASGLWGPGAIFGLLDTGAVSQNYSSWVSAGTSNDQLKLQPGVYFVSWKIVNISGANFTVWHTVSSDGTSIANALATSYGRTPTAVVPNNDPFFAYAHFTVTAVGGQDINFKFSISVANAALSQRIKITKIK